MTLREVSIDAYLDAEARTAERDEALEVLREVDLQFQIHGQPHEHSPWHQRIRALLAPIDSPTHTDLMVTPESIGPYLDANPAPEPGGEPHKVSEPMNDWEAKWARAYHKNALYRHRQMMLVEERRKAVAERDALAAQVKRWEDKEVARATACCGQEERAQRAEAERDALRAEATRIYLSDGTHREAPPDDVDGVLAEVEAELRRACSQHGPMRGPHEGYAVLLEELDELWDEVKRRESNGVAMRKEALQVAAMGARFVLDVALPPAPLRGSGEEP